MQITPADRWFSLCVRERSDWTCETCGKRYVPPTSALHNSHYFGRGNYATRFDPDNCVAQCYACHIRAGSNPDWFVPWFEQHKGKNVVDALRIRSNDIDLARKIRRAAKDGLISGHFKAEYEKMQAIRLTRPGRIEYEPVDIN